MDIIHLYTINLAHKWRARKQVMRQQDSEEALVNKAADFLTHNMIFPICASIIWMAFSWIPLIIYWATYGGKVAQACTGTDCLLAFLVNQDPKNFVSLATTVLPLFMMEVKYYNISH